MKNIFLLFLLTAPIICQAQSAPVERILDFTTDIQGDHVQFVPVMPDLMQKPGAPEAYWSYFWEFGDGSFSKEENPVHVYQRQGDYMVSLDATAHYDNGKRSKRKKKAVNSTSRLAGTGTPMNDVFDPKTRQMVAMYSYSNPKPEEEITLVISYRNLGMVNTDGVLHLFYNEKKFPAAHFELTDARTHFGETRYIGTSQVLPMDNADNEAWAWLNPPPNGSLNSIWESNASSSIIIEQLLQEARANYRDNAAWTFKNLQAGDKRNVFVSLACTPAMVSDTNAFIHLEAVFAPNDPLVAPEKFEYEIEIVSSHDPNAIAVSDNRVNYRIIGSKQLNYKVKFQNNGEGPASTVALTVDIPKGLQANAMKPLNWYPKCPICPDPPGTEGCLDTAYTEEGLLFTFRNIYLPGSRQDDVNDKDSTKGYVKYRIEADREMPKRAFKSRAKIVFDKNTPIYTNYTNTRFKMGKSPGLKFGVGFDKSLAELNTSEESKFWSPNNRYLFIGASLSPYKSWRWYPQIELLAGFKGREELPTVEKQVLSLTQPNNGIAELDSILLDTILQSSRGIVSFEVPVLIRRNFNKRFGVGLGASVRIILDGGEDKLEASRTTIDWEFEDLPTVVVKTKKVTQGPVFTHFTSYKARRYKYSLFGDITLGSVRAGPNFGIRGGFVFAENESAKPFLQLSAELKL